MLLVVGHVLKQTRDGLLVVLAGEAPELKRGAIVVPGAGEVGSLISASAEHLGDLCMKTQGSTEPEVA